MCPFCVIPLAATFTTSTVAGATALAVAAGVVKTLTRRSKINGGAR